MLLVGRKGKARASQSGSRPPRAVAACQCFVFLRALEPADFSRLDVLRPGTWASFGVAPPSLGWAVVRNMCNPISIQRP